MYVCRLHFCTHRVINSLFRYFFLIATSRLPSESRGAFGHTYTHRHTHTYINIYICMFVCVCARAGSITQKLKPRIATHIVSCCMKLLVKICRDNYCVILYFSRTPISFSVSLSLILFVSQSVCFSLYLSCLSLFLSLSCLCVCVCVCWLVVRKLLVSQLYT